MTPLRQRMIEDMQMRRYASRTQYNYVRAVEQFARHFGRSPEGLGRAEVREFLVYLATEMRVSYGTLNRYVSALRFLYRITLRKPWSPEDIPFPRQQKRLPSICTREQILRFLSSVPNIKHRAVLTTCYAGGLRVSEAARLRVADVDSSRMFIHVRQGKRGSSRGRTIAIGEGLER